ncbi:MAG: hypothetical protein KatS3mg015_0584 [Fimbriimonadales bacterium]|nr:MAG: hypothetical protein KatS3mg015_0584 [Fimbriimonadales bacterium]
MKARAWKRVLLVGFALCAAYLILISFWSRSAGEAYRQRELARDHQFHEAVERGDRAAAASLADRLVRESEQDFTGEDAMRIGAGGLLLLLVAYGVGASVYLRSNRPA